jgi:hypothetical protein
MWTTEDRAVVAGHSVAAARWQVGLEELLGRVAGRFGWVEPPAAGHRRRAGGWAPWLLSRRRPSRPAAGGLVRVASSRWRVEEALKAGKALCGLDEHQVRRWRSWYRWVTLVLLAYGDDQGGVRQQGQGDVPLPPPWRSWAASTIPSRAGNPPHLKCGWTTRATSRSPQSGVRRPSQINLPPGPPLLAPLPDTPPPLRRRGAAAAGGGRRGPRRRLPLREELAGKMAAARCSRPPRPTARPSSSPTSSAPWRRSRPRLTSRTAAPQADPGGHPARPPLQLGPPTSGVGQVPGRGAGGQDPQADAERPPRPPSGNRAAVGGADPRLPSWSPSGAASCSRATSPAR